MLPVGNSHFLKICNTQTKPYADLRHYVDDPDEDGKLAPLLDEGVQLTLPMCKKLLKLLPAAIKQMEGK